MIVANYQVQSTLRAYGEQLADRSRLSRIKPPKNLPAKDQVVFSQEARKKMMADKIATQIVNQLGEGPEENETTREILKTVSKEYGLPIQADKNSGGEVVFKVPDRNSPGGTRSLSVQEAERLKKKIFETTQAIVYNNLS